MRPLLPILAFSAALVGGAAQAGRYAVVAGEDADYFAVDEQSIVPAGDGLVAAQVILIKTYDWDPHDEDPSAPLGLKAAFVVAQARVDCAAERYAMGITTFHDEAGRVIHTWPFAEAMHPPYGGGPDTDFVRYVCRPAKERQALARSYPSLAAFVAAVRERI
jgi:hypothetical protein